MMKNKPDDIKDAVDLEALGEYVYGQNWRVIMAAQTQLDILIDLAAAKQLTPAAAVGKRNWSEGTERKIRTRCETLLMEFLGRTLEPEDNDKKMLH